MKILVVTQYFYPEEFKINDLVKGMVDRGHEVTVLTGKPNYPHGSIYEGYKRWNVCKETIYGAKVIRVPVIPRGKGTSALLAINYISFVFFSCLYVLFHRFNPDKIFCWDTSPITQAYAGILVKKKTKASLSMWVQDLWPESVTATKDSLGKGFMYNFLLRMVRGIYKHFDTLFIQATGFEKSIREKGDFNAKFVYAPNWAEDIFCNESLIDRNRYQDILPNGFKIMFAGNIGVAQDFDSILEAAKITCHAKDIKWVIVGDGRHREHVERRIKEMGLEDTVFILGRYHVTEMPSFFVHADALLVSLKNKYIFSLTIPSKVQAYLAFGKPILTMINGEGNNVVMNAKCGYTANAGDYRALADNVLRLHRASKEEKHQMGKNGKTYYSFYFTKDKIIDRIINNM